MTMKYLNTLLLSDTEFYNKHASYVYSLKKYNITTVGQLVDDNIMAPIYNNICRHTKTQLQSLISLLKYVYLNEPLDIAEILNKKLYGVVSKVQPYHWEYYKLYLSEQHIYEFKLHDFFGVKYNDTYSLERLLTADSKLKEMIANIDFKVIDLLEWILNNYSETASEHKYKAIIETYINFYKKDNKEANSVFADGTIEFFRNNITKLVKQKNEIDIQIVDMQRQLDAKIKTMKH